MRNLIQEAKERGYKKGTPIQYVPWAVDYVEGDYFEIAANGDIEAYAKPPEERKGFDDNRCDTLYSASKNKWIEIIKLLNYGKIQVRKRVDGLTLWDFDTLTIKEVIENLQKMGKELGFDTLFSTEAGGDADLYRMELESDEAFKKRIENEERIKQYQEDRERNKYERLKKKFN